MNVGTLMCCEPSEYLSTAAIRSLESVPIAALRGAFESYGLKRHRIASHTDRIWFRASRAKWLILPRLPFGVRKRRCVQRGLAQPDRSEPQGRHEVGLLLRSWENNLHHNDAGYNLLPPAIIVRTPACCSCEERTWLSLLPAMMVGGCQEASPPANHPGQSPQSRPLLLQIASRMQYLLA
jgi:hypothetical protein